MERVYFDLVAWGLYPPGLDSFRRFLQEPTWLTIKHWNHYQKNEAKVLQQQSIATAKLTSCIVGIANSFGGDKNKTIAIDDFTLYRFSHFQEEKNISPEVIDIFKQCLDKKLIVDYVLGTFLKKELFVVSLKQKQED